MAQPHATSLTPRRREDVVFVAVGLGILVVGMLLVRGGTVSEPERAVFRAVNGLPEALYAVFWPFQQVGAIVVGPIVALVALALRRYWLAAAASLATVAKLGLERVVKEMVDRQRPGSSIGPEAHLRGDVHAIGPSFVSGHAVLVAALAGVITPYLPGRWKIAPWVVVGLVMLARVYVGAHNPLDVICGAALGLAIAGLINLVVPRPTAPQRDAAGSVANQS